MLNASLRDLIPRATFLRFLKTLLVLAVAFLVLRAASFFRLFANDSGGVGVLLEIIGTLYSVLYAFATYVIWGQFIAVESEIFKESAALQDLALFSGRLNVSARDSILQTVRAYARRVADTEWMEPAQGDPTDKSDRLFAEIVSTVAALRPEDEDERAVYPRLLDIANQASVHRGERLSLSVKRMPRTLFVLVRLTAASIVFLLFLYPFGSAVLGVVALAVTTMLLFFTHFVITDLNNLFTGPGT